MRWRPWSGRLALAGILTLAGCAGLASLPSYRVTIPDVPVTELGCTVRDQPRECLMLLKGDFEALVIELKAACLALGGDKITCQTGP